MLSIRVQVDEVTRAARSNSARARVGRYNRGEAWQTDFGDKRAEGKVPPRHHENTRRADCARSGDAG